MPFGLQVLGMKLQRHFIGGRMPWAAIIASSPENDGNKHAAETLEQAHSSDMNNDVEITDVEELDGPMASLL